MSFKKTYNSKKIWKKYCEEKLSIIKSLDLNNWVYEKEGNFRDFLTIGKVSESEEYYYDFDKLEDEKFWELCKFVNDYFEMDMILFERFERSRIGRNK